MQETVIEFKKVSKSFGKQQILKEVDISFDRGQSTVIAGGSGQGKSVTLKLILGLLQPDSGEVLVGGRNVVGMSSRKLKELRQRFGVLFQGGALLDSLNVYNNVALPLRERSSLSRDEIDERVNTMLAQLELEGHGDKYPAQLSGGMVKRVGLARALMLSPEIMLFDEPTTGLDPEITLDIYRLMCKTQEEFDYTSIIVSHDIPKIFNLADKVVLLSHGEFLFFNNPEEIQLSADPEISKFARETMGDIYLSREMEESL
ncbi:MAG: ABC transporter ATP-binding protein [Desulfurivibrionaceae bacterium]